MLFRSILPFYPVATRYRIGNTANIVPLRRLFTHHRHQCLKSGTLQQIFQEGPVHLVPECRSLRPPTSRRSEHIYIDTLFHPHLPRSIEQYSTPLRHTYNTPYYTMASKFVENLEEVPTTHPHLNVSLDDVLAEDNRRRSGSHSSDSSQASSPRSGSTSPTSPNTESKINAIRRRAFTLGSKKGRRDS